MRILSKIYFFSIATLILVSCNKDFTISPEQADSFIKLFGSFQWDQGVDVKQTADGGYAILGTTTTPEKGTDLYLIKTDKYGNKDCNKELKKVGLKRLFLHAYRLEFEHPGSGQEIDITAPISDELSLVLDKL